MATRKAKLWFVGLASMRSRHNMSTQAKDLLQAEFKIRERSKMSTCELQPLASISCLSVDANPLYEVLPECKKRGADAMQEYINQYM